LLGLLLGEVEYLDINSQLSENNKTWSDSKICSTTAWLAQVCLIMR